MRVRASWYKPRIVTVPEGRAAQNYGQYVGVVATWARESKGVSVVWIAVQTEVAWR